MNTLGRVAVTSALAGFGGWVVENAFVNPSGSQVARYSHHLPNVPFLPVYAVGGASVALLAPHLQTVGPVGKFLIYAGVLTGVEAMAGLLERSEGRRSWDYNGKAIDLKHAAMWGALGLITDAIIT